MDTLIKSIEGTKIKVRMQTGGYKEFDVLDLFAINPDDLSAEMAKQAAIFGFFSVVAVAAEDVSNKASFTKDQEEASADLDTRASLNKDGVKFTEAAVKAMVATDVSYNKYCEMELKTRYDFKLLKAIVAALEQRASMLISLGAMMRSELDQTNMHIKERALNGAVDQAKATLEETKKLRKNN
jgi:hypothetical protein